MRGRGKQKSIGHRAKSMGKMKDEWKHSALLFFIIIAFTFLSFISAFADITTYEYDDNSRKVRIERGTPGSPPPPPPPGQYTLTVSISGTGTGTVTSSPAGISCGTDCSESYTSGTSVTLTATPDTGSTFTEWSGACSGTGTCTVRVDSAKSVTATLSLSITNTIRIARATPLYFSTFQAAYDAAVSGEVIQSQALHFTENLTINRNIDVTFDGGYDSSFVSNSGNKTYIKGQITTTVGGGTVTINNFVIEQ